MPVINSFIHSVSAPPATIVLTSNMSGLGTMDATLLKLTKGRSSADFQILTDSVPDATAITLAFNTLSTASQSNSRLLVFMIGAYFSGGSGSISAVTYGGNACTRAIGSIAGSDKGAAEIWSINLPINPANNNLVVTANKNITSLGVSREVLLGMTDLITKDTDNIKKDSEQFVDINVDHPANGITLLCGVLWWNGSSAATGGFSIGGASKTGQGFGASGDEFGMMSGFYASSSADSNRNHGSRWTGPGSPNQELVGASWT